MYTVVDDLAGGPLDVTTGDRRSWLDDPFSLERYPVSPPLDSVYHLGFEALSQLRRAPGQAPPSQDS